MNFPFFTNGTSSNDYKKFTVGQNAHIMICNDSAGNILNVSFDGINTHGLLYNEVMELRDVNMNEVYIKSNTAGAHCPYRVFAYGDRQLLYGANSDKAGNDNSIPSDFNPYTFKSKFPR